MDCSTPGFPVHHQLPELAQTHVHWVGDTILPSHPLLSPSPAFNLSQHQGLFQWISSLHQVAKVLELQLRHQSWFPSGWTGRISLQLKGLSRVFYNITVQNHQFFSTQLSLWSNSHLYMTTGKTIALTKWIFVGKVMCLLFNMLSRFVITFLPRSNCLLISWLLSPSALILDPKNKVCHCFHKTVSPFISMKW